jgi:hypothetical protein
VRYNIKNQKGKSVIERSRNFTNRIRLYPYNLWERFGKGEWKSTEYIPYKTWKWCGNNLKVFGKTYWERCEKMNSVKRLLEDTFLELKETKPHLFKDMEIER